MKELSLEDYPLLKGYFQDQPYQSSSYSLPSLIAWSNACYPSHYEIINGTILIASGAARDPEKRYILLPITPNGAPTAASLQELVAGAGVKTIGFVPEDCLEKIGRSALETIFHVVEQREYEDYVYLTKDLASLRGNRYAKKRNLIHQFIREYGARNRVATGPLTSADVSECLLFLEKWCVQRDCDDGQEENMACEKAAVIQALHSIDVMDWRGLWVRVDGEISAFAIMSHLTKDMGVLNFEKAYPQIKGLYQFLDNECARQLFDGYTYMNKESDMGLTALADSKKSYHPIAKIKSYSLTLKIA